jgi:putative hydrolase of the HAD superfamily
MTHKRKAVIFDLYGTLVDLQVNEETSLFWNALASDFFVSKRSISGEVLKNSFTRLNQETSAHLGEGFVLTTVFSRMLEEFKFSPTSTNISRLAESFRKHSITYLGKKPYTDDLLYSIKQAGYKLGLVSNTEALLTAYDLKALNLEDRFDAIVFSSQVGVKKPDKRIFAAIQGGLGVNPRECALVGDTYEEDILGSLDAGIDPVFLTASESNLPACGNEHVDRILCADFELQEIFGALRRIGFAIP